ncbi:MAG: hypothetical protein R3B57_06775 [Phycisphaerales bacterium]
MNLFKNRMSGLILGIGGMAPLVGAGGLVLAAPQAERAWSEDKDVNGSITSVGMENSFVITDDSQNAHTVKTNEKTQYTLDGQEATRAQVIVKGANVQAKVSEEGLALRVNRLTQ